MTARYLFIALFTPLLFVFHPAFPQSNDPAWLDDVAQQMLDDEGCIVELFININEGVVGTSNYDEARVQCRVGRLFDATRTDPDRRFTVKTCEISIC